MTLACHYQRDIENGTKQIKCLLFSDDDNKFVIEALESETSVSVGKLHHYVSFTGYMYMPPLLLPPSTPIVLWHVRLLIEPCVLLVAVFLHQRGVVLPARLRAAPAPS